MTRAERVAQAQRLCATSLTQRQVCELLGISRAALRNLIYDPDGSKARERKDRYRGTCEVCGAKTDGSNGRAKAPKLCKDCAPLATIDPCPSYNAYRRGCRCEGCLEAVRVYRAELGERLRREGRFPHGTVSGYRNFRCRCESCTAACMAVDREHRARRLREGLFTHGTATGYAYGCRCEECCEAMRAYSRARHARRKALA